MSNGHLAQLSVRPKTVFSYAGVSRTEMSELVMNGVWIISTGQSEPQWPFQERGGVRDSIIEIWSVSQQQRGAFHTCAIL